MSGQAVTNRRDTRLHTAYTEHATHNAARLHHDRTWTRSLKVSHDPEATASRTVSRASDPFL
eukprot:m.941154 g.941154  ORF g.941154 m.941154 type:complete len:62 (+) comp23832_c0_seq2:3283-3468(+)